MSIIPKSNNMIKGTRPGHLNWFNFKIWWKGNWKSLGRLYTIIPLFYFFPIHDPIVKPPWCRLWVGVSIEIAKILACQTKLSPRSGDTHGYQPALITITQYSQSRWWELPPRPGAWQCWYLGPDMNMRNGEGPQDKAPPLGVLPSYGACWPIPARDNELVKERRHV